jgi:hypothetical protein
VLLGLGDSLGFTQSGFWVYTYWPRTGQINDQKSVVAFFLSFFFWHVRLLCSVTLGLVTQVDVLHSLESIFIYFVGFCVIYWVGGGLGDLLRLTRSGLLLVDQL